MIQWLAFLVLAAIAVAGALGMLLTMSMYRAAIFLMASFVALAGLFLLLEADLLAAIQIMMNVGGMLVMLLFMVPLMMDPGGEMMWDMKRKMRLPGFGALSMSMPRTPPPGGPTPSPQPSPGGAPAGDYTCPMHPEVSSPTPGRCPKCGMDLVPRAETEVGGEMGGHAMPEHHGSATQPAPGGGAYVCPMHPEVRADHPGRCHKCGMDLVQEEGGGGDAGGTSTTYTCPMHPEVQSDQPGRCPKCGMDLVPQSDMGGGPTGGQSGHEGMAYAPTGHGESHGGHGGHGADQGGVVRMSPAAHYRMMVGMAMSTELLPWAIGLGTVAALLVGLVLVRAPWPLAAVGPTQDAVVMVGELLLERYMLGFEGAAFLILAGVVGAVVLGRRESSL